VDCGERRVWAAVYLKAESAFGQNISQSS